MLSFFKYILGYYYRHRFLYKILIKLTLVFLLLKREVVSGVKLPKYRPAGILFIHKNISYGIFTPYKALAAFINVFFVKFLRNSFHTYTIYILRENISYNFRFIFNSDYILLPSHIPIRQRGRIKSTVLHSLLNRPPHILRNRSGLLLCQTTHNGDHHFIAKLCGINVFFLKEHGYSKAFKLSDVFQTVFGVSGKSADRLCIYPVYLAFPAVAYHSLKFITLVLTSTCYSLIYLKAVSDTILFLQKNGFKFLGRVQIL